MILWGCSCEDIARFLGVNKSTVHRFAKKAGVVRVYSEAKGRRGRRPFTQKEAQRILLWFYSRQ